MVSSNLRALRLDAYANQINQILDNRNGDGISLETFLFWT